ncbi:hypothetical protein ND861_17435 [Leptospira sp. 2 VSF19]|uniref:Lipoprotein n=1 Tax=Leptospira soteropolitanensis TaxID=2950025 RepID=A0AAW5VPP3_9LEPT|nr:hypothetical protein [Leptospira soteropolitanensis]MCW7494433.1 hypothetical protein [Leptospira soteropolitanensis]MCW7502027.1 hypothetical protein [Leptospira soteropolitanensis]MCW7524279.1 hypothetical protein [Leptospira soteropolitanensis]MCW7528144.1 hypothetical protein [Leptospira soteropolitanensis]MCW7531997.1 hypothetical protein [Leptospira soteropolitanensis]
MLKHLVCIPIISFLMWSCSQNKEEGLIPGTKLTGDALTDAVVLSILTTPSCQYLTNENANTAFQVNGSISICSVQSVSGSLTVQTAGTYEVTATSGRQTLTSTSCNSSRFDFLVSLKEGNTELFSSSASGAKQISLESGKTYSIQSTGLVNPSDYQCQGKAVSSNITPYRINLRKL